MILNKIFIDNKNISNKTSLSTEQHKKEENKKLSILISTLINLLNTESYICISSIIEDLQSSISPYIPNSIIFIEALVIVNNRSNQRKSMNNFFLRNQNKIIKDEACSILCKLVFALCYYSSVIESKFYKSIEKDLNISIANFLKQIVSSNDYSLDIDLLLFNSIFNELAYLQACFQKVKIYCPSFDIFMDAYKQNIDFEEQQTKNQIIDYLLESCNADYEIQLIIKNRTKEKKSLNSKKNYNFNMNKDEVYSNISTIINRNSFINDVDQLSIREKYTFNDSDKFEMIDFIVLCFNNFFLKDFEWAKQIREENLSSSLSHDARCFFNKDFLERKEFYVNLYIKTIGNQNKMEIKRYVFTNHYKKLLDEVQELLLLN